MSRITGSPVAFKVGRRVLMVSYVSIGEWQSFSQILKLDEARAVIELAYYSLHRADFNITRRKVRRLLRKKKVASALMTLICDISIPKSTGQNEVMSDNENEADRNLKTAYRQLSMMYGWTAQEISDMSPAQIYSYQMSGKDGTGIQKMTGAEYQSFRARRNDKWHLSKN